MNSHYLLPCLLTGLITLSSALALEPLIDSSQALMAQQAKGIINKSDSNNDGKLQQDELEKNWKKYARYDKDKDGALDFDELKLFRDTSIDSPGKKLLNVRFKEVGERGVYLDFYFPDQDTSTDKPVVIFTHGGGWATGSKGKAGSGSFKQVHRALLQEGFCVLSVGYRLVNKEGDTAMRDCVIDCKDALRFISAHQKELGIDPKKIYPFGDSAGGHLAQMILFSSPETLKGDPELAKHSYQTVAGVSWYGPCDFQDVQLFNHDDRKDFRDRFGARIMGKDAKPEDKEKLYQEMSPVHYLTKDSPPLLMIQGDKDTTIPVKQAYRMQEALKTIAAPVEIQIVKNSGHNWRSVDAPIEPTRKEITQATIDFFLENR